MNNNFDSLMSPRWRFVFGFVGPFFGLMMFVKGTFLMTPEMQLRRELRSMVSQRVLFRDQVAQNGVVASSHILAQTGELAYTMRRAGAQTRDMFCRSVFVVQQQESSRAAQLRSLVDCIDNNFKEVQEEWDQLQQRMQQFLKHKNAERKRGAQ